MAKNGKKNKKSKSVSNAEKQLSQTQNQQLKIEADAQREASPAPAKREVSAKPESAIVPNRLAVPPKPLRPPMTESEKRAAKLAEHAATLFSVATGIAILMVFVWFGLPGGREAIAGFGGVLEAAAPLRTARTAMTLDVLFPLFIAAGTALLVTSVQCRGNRPLVRLILSVVMIATIADLAENALAFKMMTGGGVTALQLPLTVVKFGAFAFAGVLASCLLPGHGSIGSLTNIVLRYLLPAGLAVLVSGIGGVVVRDIVAASIPLVLLMLALYAGSLADDGPNRAS